jgi:2-polyprenyl-3-methyl-5-hydroxy-6-metoxy-1,4-benzoquinol methylase
MSNYSDSEFHKDPNSSWYKAFKYIDSKSKVLDIGCSSGTFGEVLIEQKQCVVDGIEPDQTDYEEATKKLNRVFKLNIENDKLDIIDQKYDFIYFGDVIEHLVNPVKSLSRVKALLESTGKIVFSIPNMSHISVRLMLLEGNLDYGRTGLLDNTHLHFYTHKEVQRVFNESGYVITDLSPVLKDYPREIFEQQLSNVGLKPTDDFIKKMATTEASVYQFVGTAEVNVSKKQKSSPLNVVSPVDLFQIYLDQTSTHYEAALAQNKSHIKKQEKLLKEYSNKLETSQAEIARQNQILNRKVVKLVNKIKTPNSN